MAPSSRICPSCSKLNSAEDSKCFYCGTSLGGPAALFARLAKMEAVGTKALLALFLLNFLVMVALEGGVPISFFGRGPRPSSIVLAGGMAGAFGTQMEQWRWLSACYVHLGLLHLGMNSYALLALGRGVERVHGPGRLLVLFTVTGIAGFAASRFYYGLYSPPTAGASGALFGFLGLLIADLARKKGAQARRILLENLALAVAFALMFSVNNAAHAGGFVAGALCSVALVRMPRGVNWERWTMRLGVASLALGLAAQLASGFSPRAQEARRLEVYDLRR